MTRTRFSALWPRAAFVAGLSLSAAGALAAQAGPSVTPAPASPAADPARPASRLTRVAPSQTPVTAETPLDAALANRPMNAEGVLYRLLTPSAYADRAVACDVPDVFSEALRGTLALRRVPVRPNEEGARAVIARFEVDDLNLLLTAPGAGERLTGRGVYEILRAPGEREGLAQRLALSVSFDGETPVRFDSGRVRLTSNDLAFDLTVREVQPDAEPGVPPCTVRSLRVAAAAVRPEQLIRYELGNAAAFGVQAAPLGPPVMLPASGRMALVPLPPDRVPDENAPAALREWGVVRIEWSAFNEASGDEGDDGAGGERPSVAARARGFGIYSQRTRGGAEGAGQQRLVADLALRVPLLRDPAAEQPGFAGVLNFDSGWTAVENPAGGPAPFIGVRIADTDPAFPEFTFRVVAGPTREAP